MRCSFNLQCLFLTLLIIGCQTNDLVKKSEVESDNIKDLLNKKPDEHKFHAKIKDNGKTIDLSDKSLSKSWSIRPPLTKNDGRRRRSRLLLLNFSEIYKKDNKVASAESFSSTSPQAVMLFQLSSTLLEIILIFNYLIKNKLAEKNCLTETPFVLPVPEPEPEEEQPVKSEEPPTEGPGQMNELPTLSEGPLESKKIGVMK
ncbi:hypothetical protein HELRODRAFT_179356 [Helobdella robusta]|uniref:Uncharacterized protein n=1 Tax=Helobdella robusta TaxID=6412 RepID=T1FEL5_HELRO|nr:hypothetical protein HELRODRAFT_179356 [Helobdella robusta]ESN95579.1 hypothetical protein HELRODRAFT_179356 [Helobdella robusta]